MTSSTTNNNMDDVFIQIVNDKYKEKEERNKKKENESIFIRIKI